MTVTVQNILERVEAAGVPAEWVRYNIFPHWWDEECDVAANQNYSMMAIIGIELSRTLGIDIYDLENEDAELTIKLDYAPRALTDVLKAPYKATMLGCLVAVDGEVCLVEKIDGEPAT